MTDDTLELKHETRRIEALDVNLAGSSFTNVNLADARFTDVNFRSAVLCDVNLSGVSIHDCATDGMTINGVALADLLQAYANSRTKSG